MSDAKITDTWLALDLTERALAMVEDPSLSEAVAAEIGRLRAEIGRLRVQCAIHEQSIQAWGEAFGRVSDALDVSGAGHASVLADRCLGALARLRAVVEAADAMRPAVFAYHGDPAVPGAVEAYDAARSALHDPEK